MGTCDVSSDYSMTLSWTRSICRKGSSPRRTVANAPRSNASTGPFSLSTGLVHGYPNHQLRCLSSDISDHAPLLLVFNSAPWARTHFRFDNYWTRVEDFMDVVITAWNGQPAGPGTDACRVLHSKLCVLARALTSWQESCVGSDGSKTKL